MSEIGIALELQGVSKRYPGTLAVDCVDLTFYSGEIHALIGENGAGKSTLMNIISGAYNDYTGRILLNGKEIALHSPAIAKANGIAMIHQELSLALPLSIAENLLAGRLPGNRGFLDRKALQAEAQRLLEQVGLNLDPALPVSEISQHEAQLVEIAKALGNRPCILIMDEPTSALSRGKVERLFAIARKLRQQGLAIVYISHHLPEIMQIADRVTVMRDGKKAATLPIRDAATQQLAELMVGRKVSELVAQRQRRPGQIRFRAERCSRFGFFHNVSFTIREGEILGLGGLTGAGRSELARSLCGIDPLDEGKIFLDGDEIDPCDLQTALRAGLAYLCEDRKREGLALQLSARENLLSALIAKTSRFISGRNGRAAFEESAIELQIYPPEPERPVNQFSGGNQQKVLLGKWLATTPDVCILDEPTRGVDIGAKQIIHEAIGRLADRGKCVLLISSDLPELVSLSDRIAILRKGRMIREMQKQEFSEDAVLLAANGEG